MTGRKPREIALYGKGEVGKTTTAANLSAALACAGCKVLQVGCSPRTDSTTALRGGKPVRPVLDVVRETGAATLAEAVIEGFAGVLCAETGGPVPGVVWPGGEILAAVRHLKRSGAFAELGLDLVLYDVPGDDAGGGFAVPVREAIAEHLFTVVSGDLMTIYAANRVLRDLRRHADDGGALLGGVIANGVSDGSSAPVIDDYVSQVCTRVAGYVPRSDAIARSGSMGKTVIEAFPGSGEADAYRRLAETIARHEKSRVPYPLDAKAFWKWSTRWNARLSSREAGEGVGAAI